MQISPQTIMKSLKRQTIITALCYVALGVFFIIMNDILPTTLLKAVAIFIFAVGVVNVVGYFTGSPSFSGGLSSGMLLLVLGGAIFFKPEGFTKLLYILLAVAILYDGAAKLQIAFDLLRAKIAKRWILPMLLAIVNVVLGTVILLDPFQAATTLILVVGIFMVLCGISDLATCIFCTRPQKPAQPVDVQNEGDTE